MPKSSSTKTTLKIKNIDPYRIRCKNDYVDIPPIVLNKQKKHELKPSLQQLLHTKTPSSTTTTLTLNNNNNNNNHTHHNLINLNNDLISLEKSSNKKESKNLYKYIIKSRKLSNNIQLKSDVLVNNDDNSALMQIRTLPIELTTTNNNNNNNNGGSTSTICLKCGKCCCTYCIKHKKRKKQIDNCINIFSCVYCLNLIEKKQKKSSCNGDCNNKNIKKETPHQHQQQQQQQRNCYLRYICLGTLAVTIMPCLFLYWPLRLINSLLLKCYCCGFGNNYEGTSCQCDDIGNDNESEDDSDYDDSSIMKQKINQV